MTFRKSKIVFATLVLFVLGLLAGLFLSFPQAKAKQALVASIERQGHVFIEQGDIEIGFFSLHGSNLLIQPQDQLWPGIPIKSLSISPQWLSLLSGNPGAHLQMQLFNGSLKADLTRDGRLDLTASQLDLAFLSPKDQSMTLSGQLTDLSLTSVVPLMRTSDSVLSLTLKNVNVIRKDDLGLALNLGNISLNGTGRGRSFKIISLKAEKGDLSISGGGSFLLGRDLPSTQVNMKMEIRPEDSVDPMIAELLRMSARETTGGSYQLNLSGFLPEL